MPLHVHNPAISTSCMGGPLLGRIDAASAAGFSAVEVFWPDIAVAGVGLGELRSRMEDQGLKVSSLQPLRGFEGADAQTQHQARLEAECFFEIAAMLGAAMVGVCASERPDAGGVEAASEMLHGLADVGQRYGVSLGFEALSWSTRINTPAHAAAAVALSGHPGVRTIIDAFHLYETGIADLAKALALGPPALVQIANVEPGVTRSAKEKSRHHRALRGPVPLARILSDVLALYPDAPVSIELFSDRLRSAPPQEVARQAFAALQVLLIDA